MEQYSVDGRGRSEVYVSLAVAGLALAYLARRVVIVSHVDVPWWFDVPSFAAFYGAANIVYDRWLWRLRVFGARLSEIPDFSGHWRGSIVGMDAEGGPFLTDLTVTIRQTWSRVSVRGQTRNGTTRSRIAGVRVGEEELRYEYESYRRIERVHHIGFSMLHRVDPDTLEGFYYNFEGETARAAPHGSVSLRRVAADATAIRSTVPSNGAAAGEALRAGGEERGAVGDAERTAE